MNNPHYFLPALGIVNALGLGVEEIGQRLFSGDTRGLVLENNWLPNGAARVGSVKHDLPEIPEHLGEYTCRNNQLLLAALLQIQAQVDQAIAHYGRHRIGVVIGTSTSGIAESEQAMASYHRAGSMPADYRYVRQELGTPAVFLTKLLGITGPSYAISTACTSSAKAFQSARNLLQFGLCDAVLVGGVDTLCKTTINGFSSLESISQEVCNPMSRNRNGINIGEGAALFLMSKETADIALLGIGESSDAYHVSAPHPDGLGAEAAMLAALKDANIHAKDIDYLNLHATATIKNDEMESLAVNRVFAEPVACSGTKPLTGHTLGAAGANELAFCWMALQHKQLPPHIWDGETDINLAKLRLTQVGDQFGKTSARICMSNSFAFGGSNISLIIGDRR